MANHTVVIAIFNDEESADAAATSLKDSGATRLPRSSWKFTVAAVRM